MTALIETTAVINLTDVGILDISDEIANRLGLDDDTLEILEVVELTDE